MHVQNQSRDEHHDRAAVETERRPVRDDAGISWQREPGDGDARTTGDEPVPARIDREPVTERIGVAPAADRLDTTDRPDATDRLDAIDRPDSAPAAAPDQRAVGVAPETDEPPATDEPTADGAAPADEAPAATRLWADGDGQGFRDRWRELQLRFVDDPHGATQEADVLVGEAIDGATAALAAQRDGLAGWRATGSDDTEELRKAVRNYRALLDRVLGL